MKDYIKQKVINQIYLDGVRAEEIVSFAIPDTNDPKDIYLTTTQLLLTDLIKIYRKEGGAMQDVRFAVKQMDIEELHEILVDNGCVSAWVISPANTKLADSIRLLLATQI